MATDKEQAKARSRAWYLANREAVKARSKAWRLTHPAESAAHSRNRDRAKLKAYKKAYYEARREAIKARVRARAIEKREDVRAYKKQYQQTRGPQIAAKKKAHYAAHRDDISAWHKARYRANTDAIKARVKAYAAANPEKVRAAHRAWIAAHPEHLAVKLEWQRADYRRHPEKYREIQSRRKAQKLQTQVERVNFKKILRDANGLCGICSKPFDLFGIDFDHIIPLSRGGTHTTANIQATHSHCNRAKGAKVGA